MQGKGWPSFVFIIYQLFFWTKVPTSPLNVCPPRQAARADEIVEPTRIILQNVPHSKCFQRAWSTSTQSQRNRYWRPSGANELQILSTKSKSVFRREDLDLRRLWGVRFAQSYPRLLLTGPCPYSIRHWVHSWARYRDDSPNGKLWLHVWTAPSQSGWNLGYWKDVVLGVCGLWSAAKPSKNRRRRASSKSVSLLEDDGLGRGEELPIFALSKLTNKTQNKTQDKQTPRHLFDTSAHLSCTHLVTTFVFSSTVNFATWVSCLPAASQPITVWWVRPD